MSDTWHKISLDVLLAGRSKGPQQSDALGLKVAARWGVWPGLATRSKRGLDINVGGHAPPCRPVRLCSRLSSCLRFGACLRFGCASVATARVGAASDGSDAEEVEKDLHAALIPWEAPDRTEIDLRAGRRQRYGWR